MRRRLLCASGAFAVMLSSLTSAVPAEAATGLPSDPAARGYIGFCDETGHNVTGGDIGTRPFVWKAVSSTAPPAEYQGTGQNVVLNAYQPRPDVVPGEWSGSSITAATFYSSKAHPTAQATYDDQSFAEFVQAFPAKVNGLYVLRMYYGKANFGLYNRTYPSTTIQVVGTRWHVIAGGTVDCAAAKGVSNEQLTGVVTKKQFTPRSTPPAGQTVAGSSASAAIRAAPVAVAGHGSTARATAAGSARAVGAGPVAGRETAGQDDSASKGWAWFVVLPVAVLLGLALLWWRRRSSARTDPTTS